jgi:sulfonate transport system substrate-binding protein
MPIAWNKAKRKPLYLLVLAGVFLLLALAGWVWYAQQATNPQLPVLIVSSQKDSLRVLLEASHSLKRAPYQVQFVSFPSAGPTAQAVAAQTVDVGVVGESSLAFALASGAAVKVVAVVRTKVTDTAVAILVNKTSPATSIKDLLGKKITTTKGSVGHFLALAALRKAGYSGKDVQFIFVLPGEARTLLESGQADAWATWDPYTSMAQLAGNTRVLVSGEKLFAGNIPIIVNPQTIATKSEILADFLQRVGLAYDWVNQNQQQFAEIQAKHTGLPANIHLLSNQHGQPHRVNIDAGAVQELQRSLDLFRQEGLIEHHIAATDAFDSRFNQPEHLSAYASDNHASGNHAAPVATP